MSDHEKRIIKELRECGDDPDFHPMHRALFKDAADALERALKFNYRGKD